MGWHSYDDWRPYVPVAARRRQAAEKAARLRKAGHRISPVEIAGRKIAATFWGNAWCRNLEAYSDYANRLPRGRTYVRNGSVIDLQIEAGRVRSLVSGTSIYEVEIKIKPLARRRWTDIKRQCAGKIDSLVELLQGSISKGVMEIVTRKGAGLFPSPRSISLRCSCPDWATMCKHVAATLYGVGARLDHRPELLFTLRGADPAEMVEAAVAQPAAGSKSRRGRVLAAGELSSVFGVDIDVDGASDEEGAPGARRRRRAAQSETSRKSKKSKAAPGARASTTRKPAARDTATAKKKTTKKTTKKKTKPATRRAATAKKETTGRSAIPARKRPATKTTRKKSATQSKTKKPAAKKPAAQRKTGSRKTGARKAGTRKAGTKKAGTKKKGATKTRTKKAGTKKAGTKKTAVRKRAARKTRTKHAAAAPSESR